MATQIDTAQREVVLIEEAHIRPMMGLDILEPLPSARIPYPMVDPVSRSQIAVLGPGAGFAVAEAQPGTRFILMAGKPYGEVPVYNGPYVD